MRHNRIRALVAVVVVAALLTIPGLALAAQNFGAHIVGGEETPAVSTLAIGFFFAVLNDAETALDYTLVYFNLQGVPSAAHIHLGQRAVAGGVSAFLCGGGGKPACPTVSGTFVTGTIVASDVTGPTGQGIAAGELADLIRAMRAGDTYANVHTDIFPGGEIRGQIR